MMALLSYSLLFPGRKPRVGPLSSVLILQCLVYNGFEHGLYSYRLKRGVYVGGMYRNSKRLAYYNDESRRSKEAP